MIIPNNLLQIHLKLLHKKAVKTAEATSSLIGNKIVVKLLTVAKSYDHNKMTGTSRTAPSKTEDEELQKSLKRSKERYISPEKKTTNY